MLEHGGDLVGASREFGIPPERWLDLSTGINPAGYPVTPVPAKEWQRLPGDYSELEHAAVRYYGVAAALAVPGTQSVIQALPRLRPHSRVTLPILTYSEHGHAWRRYGHSVREMPAREFEKQLGQTDVLIVCNPNNPTGENTEPRQLLEWQARLAARGGWLVLDEAYIDATPEHSLAPVAQDRRGLIVLRSLGKFFGLAGARVGFTFAEPALLQALQAELGPWGVSGPAQFVARTALADRAWQVRACTRLHDSARRLQALLTRHGIDATGCSLFQYWQHERAAALYCELARQAVLTRRFREGVPAALRFGLPGTEEEWGRFERALAVAVARWKETRCA